eukprot:Skav203712  [mRNA]  locus=scaffold259:546792:549035:- [translate_table: standard]
MVSWGQSLMPITMKAGDKSSSAWCFPRLVTAWCGTDLGINGTLERLDLWVQRLGELVSEKLLPGGSSVGPPAASGVVVTFLDAPAPEEGEDGTLKPKVWERHVALCDDAGEKLLVKCREDLQIRSC